MRHGPWDHRRAVREAVNARRLPRSIDGREPVAIESNRLQHRFLYELPDREPLSVTRFPPMREYLLL